MFISRRYVCMIFDAWFEFYRLVFLKIGAKTVRFCTVPLGNIIGARSSIEYCLTQRSLDVFDVHGTVYR